MDRLHRHMLQEQRLSRYETAGEMKDDRSMILEFEHTRMECLTSSNGTFTAVMTLHWDAPKRSQEPGVLAN